MTESNATSTTETATLLDPLDVALAKIGELETQVADYKLLIADMQNSTRRLRDDADRQRKYASEPVVKDLLGAFDNLDRAAAEAKKVGDTGPLAQGVTATVSMFLGVLERYGVRKIEELMTTAGVKVSAAEAASVLPVLRPMVAPLTEVT